MALKYRMDMSIDGAKHMSEVALNASRMLEDSLRSVRQGESEEVFLAYRSAVANTLMVLLLEIQNPIHAKYPELKPLGWK